MVSHQCAEGVRLLATELGPAVVIGDIEDPRLAPKHKKSRARSRASRLSRQWATYVITGRCNGRRSIIAA